MGRLGEGSACSFLTSAPRPDPPFGWSSLSRPRPSVDSVRSVQGRSVGVRPWVCAVPRPGRLRPGTGGRPTRHRAEAAGWDLHRFEHRCRTGRWPQTPAARRWPRSPSPSASSARQLRRGPGCHVLAQSGFRFNSNGVLWREVAASSGTGSNWTRPAAHTVGVSSGTSRRLCRRRARQEDATSRPAQLAQHRLAVADEYQRVESGSATACRISGRSSAYVASRGRPARSTSSRQPAVGLCCPFPTTRERQ